MKKILMLAVAVVLALPMLAANKEKDCKYVDASKLTVINKAQPGGNPFARLETEKYPDLTSRPKFYLGFPTGIALRFRTNSDFIKAQWTTGDTINRVNSAPLSSKGLDLYIRKDGKWLHAGVGTPKYTGKKHSATIVANMDTTMKECLLYLPTFAEMYSLKLGVNPKSELVSDGGFVAPKIVAMGSSITHGSGTSRPGMTWPALLSRKLDMDIANLGTSGVCKLEPFFADIIADTEADLFIFDVFSNPSAEQIHERFAPFIKRIRETHPTTPLLFLQTEVRETGNFDLKKRKFEADKRQAAEEELKKAMATDKNIYFLNPGLEIGNDHEATVDLVHPTDLGYMRIVDHILPTVKSLLNQKQ